MNQFLTAAEQTTLLRLARQTIETVVRGGPPQPLAASEWTPALRLPHAAFVTLKKRGELRGCIGLLKFDTPLAENVVAAAEAAALRDPRFTPVTVAELAEIVLEVTVLEPPVPIARPDLFDVRRHGIVVQRGWQHALLLPQVAREYGWDAAKTLETVCWKAGLPAAAWCDPQTQLQVFEALDFGEAEQENGSGT